MIVLDKWWRISWSLRSLIAKRIEYKKWVIFGARFRVRKFLFLGKKRGEWNAKWGRSRLWLVSDGAKLGGIFAFLHGFEFGVGVWVDISFIYERNENLVKGAENLFGFGWFLLLVISWGKNDFHREEEELWGRNGESHENWNKREEERKRRKKRIRRRRRWIVTLGGILSVTVDIDHSKK